MSLLIEPELQLAPSELKALAEPADADVRANGTKINAFAQLPGLGILSVAGGGGGGGVPSAASGSNPIVAANTVVGSSVGGGGSVGSGAGQQTLNSASTVPGVTVSVPPVLNQGNSSPSSSTNGTANNVVIASVVAPVPDAAPTLVLLGLTTLGLLGTKWSRRFRGRE